MAEENRFPRLRTMTEEPKNPQEGDVFYNPVLDGLFVYLGPSDDALWDHGWTQIGVDVPPDGYLDEIKEMHRQTRKALDVLMDAIGLSHDPGPGGKCRRGCPGCLVEQRVHEVMVARRFME